MEVSYEIPPIASFTCGPYLLPCLLTIHYLAEVRVRLNATPQHRSRRLGGGLLFPGKNALGEQAK
jgi:hypothetical protein